MEFFVRVMERHKTSTKDFSPEVACTGLDDAKDEAKRQAREANPELMLQADACVRTNGHVVTKYRCRVNELGELHEYHLK